MSEIETTQWLGSGQQQGNDSAVNYLEELDETC
jgi:hypothetical protein